MDVIPSLTVDGFITNKRTQISKIMEYFLASDKSQSNTFYGKVYSLKGILQEYVILMILLMLLKINLQKCV